MNKLLVTAIVIAASAADAADLQFAFVRTSPHYNIFSVYVEVTGDTTGVDGLLNYDIGLSGLESVGIDSGSILFGPANLFQLDELFQPRGFPDGNFVQGPSGPDIWSAGHSQFNVANPVAGIGITDAQLIGSTVIPSGNDIFFDVPAWLGRLDLGTDAAFSIAELEPLFTAGGTLYGNGDTSVPITPDSLRLIVIPEPSSEGLACLVVVSLAGRWRRV